MLMQPPLQALKFHALLCCHASWCCSLPSLASRQLSCPRLQLLMHDLSRQKAAGDQPQPRGRWAHSQHGRVCEGRLPRAGEPLEARACPGPDLFTPPPPFFTATPSLNVDYKNEAHPQPVLWKREHHACRGADNGVSCRAGLARAHTASHALTLGCMAAVLFWGWVRHLHTCAAPCMHVTLLPATHCATITCYACSIHA